KAIDRLHRVAHEKQGAAVARFPPRREDLEQSKLPVRRVLELVDEDVPDPVVEREQQIRWRVVAAERFARRERDLDEIDDLALGEDDAKLRRRAAQHEPEIRERTPLLVRVARLGQTPDAIERG